MDAMDIKAAARLQTAGRESWTRLAELLGVTGPAAAERVRRLEEAGIITGYHAQVDLARLGLMLTVIIRLAPRGRPAGELGRLVAALPEVLECHHVTGEDCYVLEVAVPSVGHLEQLLERLLRYGDTTTSMVLSSPVTHRAIGPEMLPEATATGPQTKRRVGA